MFDKQITLGEFFSLLFYSFFLFNPLSEISNVVTAYREAKASNEELEKIYSLPKEESDDGKKELDKINSIEFKKVSFNYNSRDSSFSDINLKIDKNKGFLEALEKLREAFKDEDWEEYDKREKIRRKSELERIAKLKKAW